MSKCKNSFCIGGHLAADPVLSYAPNGAPYTKFTVACNYQVKVENGYEDRVRFLPVTMFGPGAEAIKTHKHKGDYIFVDGYIDVRYSEPDSEGKSRMYINLMATDVYFGGTAKGKDLSTAEPGAESILSMGEEVPMSDTDNPF